MTKLPDGWIELRLDQVISNLENGTRPRGGVNGITSGIPSIGGEHISSSGSFDFSNVRYVSQDFFEQMNRGKIKHNDVLIVKDGATTGRVSLVRNDFPFAKAAVNEHVFILRPNQKVIPGYLYYFLYSSVGQKRILSNFHGSAQGGINSTFITNCAIPIPPLETQKKIVALLEKVKKLIGLREEANELTNEYLKAVFYEMFGDPVTNPENWPTKKIGKITEVKTGGTPSRDVKEFWESGHIPWVKTTEVDKSVITETEECITELGLNNCNGGVFPKNSILIAMYGQGKTRGRTGILGIPAATNQACAVILPSGQYNTDYLLNYLILSYERLRNLGRGGNQPNLNLGMVKDFTIFLPPFELQLKYAKIAKQLETLMSHQIHSKRYISELFNSTMQSAFKGELTC